MDKDVIEKAIEAIVNQLFFNGTDKELDEIYPVVEDLVRAFRIHAKMKFNSKEEKAIDGSNGGTE